MTLESLRQAAQAYVTASKNAPPPPCQEHLPRREIKKGVRDIYRKTGEFIGVLKQTLGTTSFMIEKPNLRESGLPQPIIDFFETQYELSPEDITFKISAERDMHNQHIVDLQLIRRGHNASSGIRFCSYVHSAELMDSRVEVTLDHEQMQPKATLEAKKEISRLLHPENPLTRDISHLRISRGLFDLVVNEATKYITSQTQQQEL